MVVLRVKVGPGAPELTLSVDERTTVQNVVLLLSHQHPEHLSPSLIPMYRLGLEAPGGAIRWLERQEVVGTYAITDADRLVVGDAGQQALLSAEAHETLNPPHALCRVVVPAEHMQRCVSDARLGSPTLLDALAASHTALRGLTSREIVPDRQKDTGPAEPDAQFARGRARPAGSLVQQDCAQVARDALWKGAALAGEQGEFEVLLWPPPSSFIPAPTWRARVVVPRLGIFKTVVLGEHVTVEDVVIALWLDIKTNHMEQIPHWSRHCLCSPKAPTEPMEPLRSMTEAVQQQGQWWSEAFVFTALPESTAEAIRPTADPLPPSASKATGVLLCTVLVPHKASFSVTTLPADRFVCELRETVARQCGITSERPGVLFLMHMGDEGQWVSSAMDPARRLGSYAAAGPNNALVMEYREASLPRSLTVVTGVHYTIGVLVQRQEASTLAVSPSTKRLAALTRPKDGTTTPQEAPSRGVFLCGPTTTVREAITEVAVSLGEQPDRYRVLMPEIVCMVKARGEDQLRSKPDAASRAYSRTVGDPARGMWTYLLRLSDDIVVEPVAAETAVRRVELITGEIAIRQFPEVTHESTGALYPGTLHVTTYRLLWAAAHVAQDLCEDVEIPASSISGFEVGDRGLLRVFVKDIRIETFVMQSGVLRELMDVIKPNPPKWYIPPRPVDTFAFTGFRGDPATNAACWSPYDPRAEFARQRFNPLQWRISEANTNYSLCETYPSLITVPLAVTDDELRKMAEFRSRKRVPAVCWIHPTNGATISRCSQPTAGMLSRRCTEDERFFQLLIKQAIKADEMVFVDLRDELAATANALKGGGTEKSSNYVNCVPEFLELGNMHEMRASFYKLSELCLDRQHTEDGWLRDLDATGWMKHLQKMLRGAVRLSDLVVRGIPVMAHCSDGWDRTPKVIALAELLLDPYYRTLVGFEALIEKEWLSFGHQFEDRSGIGKAYRGSSPDSDKNISPIFIMFLDCVWQIVQQFPAAFQFNDHMLLFLADAYYNCRFGTFLFNCERGRVQSNAPSMTTSVWSYIGDNFQAFTNPAYTVGTDAVLIPSTSLAVMRLWAAYYMRYNEKLMTSGGDESRVI